MKIATVNGKQRGFKAQRNGQNIMYIYMDNMYIERMTRKRERKNGKKIYRESRVKIMFCKTIVSAFCLSTRVVTPHLIANGLYNSISHFKQQHYLHLLIVFQYKHSATKLYYSIVYISTHH